MKHLALKPVPLAVHLISEEGVAKELHMNPNLMGAPSVKSAFDQGEKRGRGAVPLLDYPVIGACFPASGILDDCHFLAVYRVAAQWGGDGAGRVLEAAGGEGQVNLLDRPPGELLGEGIVGKIILGDDHAAAGFFVEAMDYARALLAADA